MSTRIFHERFPASVLAIPLQSWHLSSESDDDEALFAFQDEEADDGRQALDTSAPWVLLIVDDEPQVHEATTMTLHRGHVANRPFHFLHAHSAAQAREIIASEAQIDLVLLDVVMETRDAGLKLVSELRGPLGRNALKILIRSGQPGFEKDSAVREHYAVDGYLQKTEQTYTLMMDVIGSLLTGKNPDHERAN